MNLVKYLLLVNFVWFTKCNPTGTAKGCQWNRTNTTGAASEQNEISCKIRTINKSENLFGTFRSYEIEKISKLRLECSDRMFFESSLESVTLVNRLTRLKELTIEYCKIRYVPSQVFSSLRDLRTLNMRTHNSDWSAINLELHPESFRGLTELRNLDLSESNIWSVPTDVFCPLYSLRILNLTGNRLNDVSQLGFSDWGSNNAGPIKACNTGLEILNLSKNDVTVIFDSSFSALRSLEQLLLQNNHLSSISDHAFNGLQSLQLLNISSNKLKSLSSDIFRSTKKLRELYLHNNSISSLSFGLLTELEYLEILDLSHNHLRTNNINSETFKGLIRLIVLNLSYNTITHIDELAFSELSTLQVLHLENNQIESIAPNSFDDLKNLMTLSLSNNKLKRIEMNYFNGLFELKFLFIESNLIEYIHPEAFDDLTTLNDLSLNENFLNTIPEAIKQLTFLNTLDLGKNEIREIHNSSFEGMNKLTGLRMVDNFINNITANAFGTISQLQFVNLASNSISSIDRKAFEANTILKAIRLDDNKLENITELFTTLADLVVLNISHNKINKFDYISIPKSVEWLNINHNLIEEIDDLFKISSKHNLKIFDISHNKLITINNSSFPDQIETIMLNNNNIEQIDPHTFFTKENLKKVDLIGNKLKTIDRLSISLKSTQITENNDVPEFFFDKNPLVCDCNIEWLQKINNHTEFTHYPRIADLNILTCVLEGSRNLVKKLFIDVTSDEFLCKYNSHCFALCHCCDYNACDCKMQCPEGCRCYHDSSWNTNIVDCGNSGYDKIPEQIPMDVTTLYLDGNNFGDLDSHIFIGKKKLEFLFMNSSRVTKINNRTFNGIPSLRVLHLEDNKLNQLNGYEFKELTTLSELHLDRNLIVNIDNKTFNKLNNLKVLSLSDNNIVNFNPKSHFLTDAERRTSGSNSAATQLKAKNLALSVKGNKYSCDCDTLINLSEWFNYNIEIIENLQCTNDSKSIIETLELCNTLKNLTSVTENIKRTLLDEQSKIDYTLLLIIFLVFIFILIMLLVIYCYYKKQIILWLHSTCGLRLAPSSTIQSDKIDETAKLYDGYVVYSALDSAFVHDEFAHELEQQGYSVCLHHRDIHSMAFLADSLQSASDASKRIVLVLSINFLQGEWSDPHFRIALHSTLELIRPSNRRKKLIIIQTAPSNIITADPIMEVLLRTCTVINWVDKKFWEKLKYAMPDANETLTSAQQNYRINPVQRYTPAPTTLDMWYRRSCQNHQIGIGHNPNEHKTPSQCTYNTEDELSSVSSQYNEPISQHNYNNRASLGHVYSTIPETPTPQPARCEASYL